MAENFYIWSDGQFIKKSFSCKETTYFSAQNIKCFEKLIIYQDILPHIEKYLDYISKSLKEMLIETCFTISDLEHVCLSLIKMNQIDNGWVQVTVSNCYELGSLKITIDCWKDTLK